MAEAGLLYVGGDAGSRLPQPLADAAVGIVVEAVHAARTHALLDHVAVPALPDGGGAVIDRIEPAGVLVLQQEGIGHVVEAAGGEGGHEDAGAEEACLQAVAVVLEVLGEAGYHVFACLAFHQAVAQGEEGWCLHGVEDGGDEGAVLLEELAADVGLGLGHHLFERSGIAACGFGHVAHHLSIDDPIGSAEVVPVGDGVGQRALGAEGTASATLQWLVAQPVGPLVVAVLGAEGGVVVA